MLPVSLAASLSLAAAPAIDLYTMGPGDDVIERYGHAAICVVFPDSPDLDRCFNYGTGDFLGPPLVQLWRFLRHETQFWVSYTDPQLIYDFYEWRDRTVYRQRLPLTPEQVLTVARKLEWDAREENKYYQYHHFRDNCSTRIRDLIDAATQQALSNNSEATGLSYRDLGRQGLAEMWPLQLISDVGLGRPSDEKLTHYQAMFLPDYLREGVKSRFGASPEVVYQRKGPSFPSEPRSGRGLMLIGTGLAAGWVALLRQKPLTKRLASISCGLLLGVLGLLIWGIAAISIVPELRYNEALLVFMPSDALLLLAPRALVQRYARFRLLELFMVSLLMLLGVLIQPMWAVMTLPAAIFAIHAEIPQWLKVRKRDAPADPLP